MKKLQLTDAQRINIALDNLPDGIFDVNDVGLRTFCTNMFMLGFSTAEKMLDIENENSDESYEQEINIFDDNIEERFNELKKRWEEETGGLSSPRSIRGNINYLKIIDLAKNHQSVIPLIFKSFKEDGNDWFGALYEIIPESEQPKIKIKNTWKQNVDIWLKWGKKNGFLD